MNTSAVTIKNSGATFTPVALADFLSDKILKYLDVFPEKCTILDPACGDGVLLASITKKINDTFVFELRGYETIIDYLSPLRKVFLNHKEHKANTKDTKKRICITTLCALCEISLCTL